MSSRRRRLNSAVQRGFDHIGGVLGAERLGQDIFHAGGFEDGAHGFARDDAGARRGRPQQHLRAAVMREDFVRNGRVLQATRRPFASGPFRRPCEWHRPLRRPCPGRRRRGRCLSPTTISALKLNRRPPLTTLAERLMNTTFSVSSCPDCAVERRVPGSGRAAPPAAWPRVARARRCSPLSTLVGSATVFVLH